MKVNVIQNAIRALKELNPRQSFIVLQSMLAITFLVPLGVWRIAIDDFYRGAWDFCLAIILLVMAWLSTKDQMLDWIARVIAVILSFGMWLVLDLSGPSALMWAFVALLALFFVLRIIEAVVASGVILTVCVLTVVNEVDSSELITFVSSFVLVSIFALIFSSGLWRENVRLERVALKDPLTDVSNRRAFDASVQRIVNEFDVDAHASFSMLVVDIDHFKSINDTWGHAVGDICLSRIAQVMSQEIPNSASLYRFGGEEFVVLMPFADGDATMVAEAIRQSVASKPLIRDRSEPVTVSIGVAQIAAEDDAVSWLERADKALYKAKRDGRNRVEVA